VAVRVGESLDGIDWARAKADLAADDFDNGRSPHALRASFERSEHVAIAWDGDRVVGMARLLSDGVCNAYLLDVWTMSAYRRQGIGTAMVRRLMSRVPGQHIGLQTGDAEAFYASLGYRHQPAFMSVVAGEWLANEANARLRPPGGRGAGRAGRQPRPATRDPDQPFPC
jgi:GNAT superfamily N-acetyltransferase